MRILVTGAAGFIGAHVSEKLSDLGHQLVLVDRFSDYYSPEYKHQRLKAVLKNHQPLILDVDVCSHDLESVMRDLGIEVVLHLAAQPGIRIQYPKTLNYLSDNIEGFSCVLKASLSVGVKKFVYASSSSVYEASASEVFTETSVLSPPKNLYAFTKWVNEATAKMFFEQKVTKILGLRFFSVYGPWGRPDMAPLRLITSCLTDYKFQLNGDGLVRRDFTYIDDVVLAVVQLIESDNMPEGVLNIGGGNDRSIRELISICEDLTRANLDLQRISSNNSELPKTKANPSKLEDILGVIPETSLEEGIAKTFDWARQPLILGKLKEWVQSV